MDEKFTLDIYTDGACSGNPGVGGWGVVILMGDFFKEFSGAEPKTTNNRMELVATIMGLKALKEACNVNLYSDSAYVVNAFSQGWLDSWQKNNWRNSSNDEVKNKDLWEELFNLTKTHSVTFIKVKGHADNEFNNRCDTLATTAIKDYIKEHPEVMVKPEEEKPSSKKTTNVTQEQFNSLIDDKITKNGEDL